MYLNMFAGEIKEMYPRLLGNDSNCLHRLWDPVRETCTIFTVYLLWGNTKVLNKYDYTYLGILS